MARSLNQAFIKAYSKDSKPRDERQSLEVPADDYILRIDTLNLELPETHLGDRLASVPKVAQTAEIGALAPSPQVGESESDPKLNSLRDSIADQMLRATEWRGTQARESAAGDEGIVLQGMPELAAADDVGNGPIQFQSGQAAYPTPPPNVELQPELHSSPQQDLAERAYAAADEPAHYQLQDQRSVAYQQHQTPPMEAASEQAAIVEVATATSKVAHHGGSVSPEAAGPAASQIQNTSVGGDLASSTPLPRKNPNAARSTVAYDDAKVSSPSRNGEGLHSSAINGLSSAEVERIVQRYVERHGKDGEIFRLDRPSYTTDDDTPVVRDGESFEQSGELVFEESEQSHTALDIDAQDVGTGTSQQRMAAAQAAEQSLREARTQVFNPVWEVDRLQWPHVCEELIKQRQDNLMQVARNLTKACEQGLQVLAVTSPSGGEGRTTVACCLAKLAAVSGLRVALVDGDLENPSVAYQTNLDLESDWKTALVEEFAVEEVAVHAIEDQVTLVPLLDPIGPDELTADDDRICEMLHQLSSSFDLIIIDTAPLESDESLAMTMAERGVVNAIITVVDRRQLKTQDLEQGLQRIRRTGVSSVGLVENFSD